MLTSKTDSSPVKRLGMLGVIAFLLFVSPFVVFAQGTIHGVVRDSLTTEPLLGANVFLLGTAFGSASDREGTYRIQNVPAGPYSLRISYIGYRSRTINVNVGVDELVVDAHLLPDLIEGQEVVITAQARGQVAAINQQRTANTIVNVVSQEKIQDLPDANAAEAIGRLPGVSIIRSGGEANKVILRGLEDKFTSITIDGVKIPPTDATSRGVDLSMLSQSSLAGVELYKALTPDKDGDALAGSINLVTRKAPEVRDIKADMKGDYNDLMASAWQYIFALHYGERFFDNILGVQITGNLEKRIRSNERINVDYGRQDLPNYFINNFRLEFTDEKRTRDGLSVLLDLNTPDDGSLRISNVYGRTKRDYFLSTREYPSGGGGTQQGQPVYDYRDREQDTKTLSSSIRGDNNLFGFSLNWGASFAESQSEFPYDYESIFVEPSGMNPTPEFTTGPEQIIPYAINNFSNASLYWAYYRTQDNYDKEKTAFLNIGKRYLSGGMISGEIKIGAKFKVKDRSNARTEDFTPYYLGRWQTHERLPDGTFRKKDFTGTYFEEWQKSGGGFIGIDRFFFGGPPARDVYGSYSLTPLIAQERLRQWRELNKYGIDATGNQLEIWGNPLIRYDDYFVTERVAAGYMMNTLNVGQDLTIIAGVRLENEDNNYLSTFMPQPVSGFPIPTNSITDTTSSFIQSVLLPNLNISYRPFDFMSVRVAAYKALGRPDFNMRLNRYIAGRPAEVGTQFQVFVGNPSLRTSKAWNIEVNTSFYDNSLGLISLSAYYKDITDMYHMLNNFNTVGDTLLQRFGSTWKSQMRTTPYNLTIPYNSPKPTKVWGFELEQQINFHFLPEPFKNFVLSYNASLVRSETVLYGSRTITYVDSSGPFPLTKSANILVERKQKLEGMPEFFGNIALGYDLDGFSARVSVFHQGEHNLSFSATGLNDRLTTAFTRVDVALKQKVTPFLSLSLNFNNVTNIEDGSSIFNRVFDRTLFDQSEMYGLTADFGVTLEL